MMRLSRKWFFLAVPLFALGTACTEEYNQISDLRMDDVNPEFIFPVVNDTLKIATMVERNAENTKIEYDNDGTAYVEYSRELELFGSASNVFSDFYVTNTGSSFISQTMALTPSSTVGGQFDLPLKYYKGFGAERVEIPDFAPNKSIKLLAHPTTVVFRAHSAVAELIGKEVECDFTLIDGLKKTVKIEITAENVEKDVNVPVSHALNEQNLELTNGKYSVTVSNAHLVGTDKSGDVSVYVLLICQNCQVEAVDDIPYTLPSAVGSGVKFGGEDELSPEISLFSTTKASNLKLPHVSVTLEIQKAEGVTGKFSIDQLECYYNDEKTPRVIDPSVLAVKDIPAPIRIGATEENIIADQKASKAVFVLNHENSKVGDVFTQAVRKFTLRNFKGELTSGTVNSANAGNFKAIVKAKLPFYGEAISNTMVSEMDIADDAFPQEALDYIKEGESQGGKLKNIQILFRFNNSMPLNLFAKMEFLDAAGTPIVKLDLKPSNTSLQSPDDLKLPVFIESAEVDKDGKLAKSVRSQSTCELTKQQYELIAKNARKLRTTYVAETPKDKNVYITRNLSDYVTMNVAVDLSATYSLGKKKKQ